MMKRNIFFITEEELERKLFLKLK